MSALPRMPGDPAVALRGGWFDEWLAAWFESVHAWLTHEWTQARRRRIHAAEGLCPFASFRSAEAIGSRKCFERRRLNLSSHKVIGCCSGRPEGPVCSALNLQKMTAPIRYID